MQKKERKRMMTMKLGSEQKGGGEIAKDIPLIPSESCELIKSDAFGELSSAVTHSSYVQVSFEIVMRSDVRGDERGDERRIRGAMSDERGDARRSTHLTINSSHRKGSSSILLVFCRRVCSYSILAMKCRL